MSRGLVADLERFAESLGAPDSDRSIPLPAIAARIAESLGVQPDEVAILLVSRRNRCLDFLVPEKLSQVGSIPLSNPSSLATRTVRESRPEIHNKFSSVRHASVFEGVPLPGRESTDTIQKIVSAPILSGKKVVGVLQISRKGADLHSAGKDFTADDLGKILALCRPLGRLLESLAGESGHDGNQG